MPKIFILVTYQSGEGKAKGQNAAFSPFGNSGRSVR